MDYINLIWHWKIQIFPILFAIFLFEVVAIIRRWKKLYYVPIYFSVFPLRVLNENLSAYLLEDEYCWEGENLTTKEAENLRKKIILTSIISMIIGALLTPLIVGFCSAFFMSNEVFVQFLFILIIYKSVLLTKSVFDFSNHYKINSKQNYIFLCFIYVCYLGVVFEVLRKSFNWAFPYVQDEKWNALFSDLSSLVFGQVLVDTLVLSLITAIFVSLITDRKLREEELKEIETARDE